MKQAVAGRGDENGRKKAEIICPGMLMLHETRIGKNPTRQRRTQVMVNYR